jgi:protein CpxP
LQLIDLSALTQFCDAAQIRGSGGDERNSSQHNCEEGVYLLRTADQNRPKGEMTMTSIRKIAMTFGMAMFAGVLMAQSADQNANAAANANAGPQAQTSQRRAADPAREVKHLGKKLGLSQDQVAQLGPILADRQQQMQALRADTTMSQTDRRAKFRSIRDDSKGKIEAVLNDQQKQQFEQMMASRRSHQKSAPQAQ